MVPGWDCDSIYCGFWSDQSSHPVFRGTLTLPSQWALILVGFFTLFITIIGGYLWDTIAFVIHQVNSSSKPQLSSYHQLQLILRNTDNNASFISHLSKIAWAHRQGGSKIYFKSVALFLFASLYALAFALGGGFSSTIIAARDPNVLTIDRNCGWLQEPTYLNPQEPTIDNIYSISAAQFYEYINVVTVMVRNAFRKSASHSRSCYGGLGENSAVCNNFVQPTLPYTINRNVTCPFNEKACNGTAISLDTGRLRSDVHLGVNTRPEDALSVRMVLTCVPLAGEKYTTGWQPIAPEMAFGWGLPFDTKIKSYAFGPSMLSFGGHVGGSNYTASMDEVHWVQGVQPYSLQISNAILDLPPNPTWKQFAPIDDLLNTTADTTIIGLTNRNMFGASVSDPWFRADNCTVIEGGLYPVVCEAPNPLSFLGCQQQYQFCKAGSADSSATPDSANKGSHSCTPLTGLYRLFPDLLLAKGPQWNGTKLSDLNPTQEALYYFLAKTMASSQLHWQLGFIGHENLIAQDALWDGGFGFETSADLPSNQWETEVMNWMNVTLASTQRGTVAYSRPSQYDVSSTNSSLQYIEQPQDPELRNLCGRIKMRSAHHNSFSVFGMAATISFGLMCILCSYVIRPLFTWTQQRTGHGIYKGQEWTDSSAFHLQRKAAEGKGIGPWKDKVGDVPTLVEPELRFSLADRRQYGNVEVNSDFVSNNGHGVQYQPLNKRLSPQQEEIESQGFFELRNLGGRTAYSS
ncbi:hypothetical protein BKA63DRAFT_557922 [Paraphoma chrysanthemicola]|nr:hypothetical protein BKA63DRAFT_557922 [Paraphoma chrysanthemicola]